MIDIIFDASQKFADFDGKIHHSGRKKITIKKKNPGNNHILNSATSKKFAALSSINREYFSFLKIEIIAKTKTKSVLDRNIYWKKKLLKSDILSRFLGMIFILKNDFDDIGADF